MKSNGNMEVEDKLKIPLFPLETVLFPRGVLPLRIFEPRYLDMVSNCMKNESGIGVVLIKEGHETGAAAIAHEVGTLSYVSYWHKRNDGMLGITLTGEQRFRILSTETKRDQLIMADVELLANIDNDESEHDSEQLTELLDRILSRLTPPFTTMAKHYDDLEWVSARLIELLPLKLYQKQQMLNIGNVNERINNLYPLLVTMEII